MYLLEITRVRVLQGQMPFLARNQHCQNMKSKKHDYKNISNMWAYKIKNII